MWDVCDVLWRFNFVKSDEHDEYDEHEEHVRVL